MVRRPPRGTRIPSHKCPNLRSDVKANLNGKLFVDASFPRHTREFDDVMGVMESSLNMCFRMAKKDEKALGNVLGDEGSAVMKFSRDRRRKIVLLY